MPRGRPPKLVKQVLQYLQDELRGLKDGAGLPPELNLVRKYGVSRKTVRAAMRQLETQRLISRVRGKGTFPTQGARARPLFRTQLKEIGMVSFGGSAFYSSIIDGAVHEAMLRECQVVLSGGPAAADRAEACWRLVDDNRIAGLALLALTDQALLEQLARRGKPICLVDHYTERAEVDCVRVDSAAGSRTAVEHLWTLGHRRIAYIDAAERSTNVARYDGYVAGLAAHRVQPRPEWIAASRGAEDSAKAALGFVALPAARRPTAIIAFSDEMALWAMQAIIRFGLRVPEDLSVVGFGGPTPVLTVNLPELTSVRFDTSQVGRAAVRCVLERLENPALPCRNVMLPGALHLGQSTARPDAT